MADLFGINAHRQAVQENIEKAFDLGFDADNNIEGIEKAKHQVGDIHPNGRWVWTEWAPGKFDWKSLKGKHHKGNQQTTTQSTSSNTSVDISKISDKEFKGIARILEKKNPNDSDAFRYLESEEMNDKELANFIACAKHFKNDTKNINETTRKRCAKWEKLGEEELNNRNNSKNEESKKQVDTQITDDKEVTSFMDKIKVFGDKYNDPSKVSVSKTPKGNWNVRYDGHRLGIIDASALSEETANKQGWNEGSGEKFKQRWKNEHKDLSDETIQSYADNSGDIKYKQDVVDAAKELLEERKKNKQDEKKEFTESSFKNSFDSIISNISSIVDEVFVEKPVGDDFSTVDKTYKTSDWKEGVHVVGDALYGKDELLQLDINKKGGDIGTIQLRKPISNGMMSSYNNQPIGHVIVEVALRSKNSWLDFDMTKESSRKDFAELLNKNISNSKDIDDTKKEKDEDVENKSAKLSAFVNKTLEDIKDYAYGNFDDDRLKKAEKVLAKNESFAKKFMSATFPAASGSALSPSEKEISISDDESIILSAYKTTDTTSRDPAYRGSTDYHYAVYHKVGDRKKLLYSDSYSRVFSARYGKTSSEIRHRCKIIALAMYFHI